MAAADDSAGLLARDAGAAAVGTAGGRRGWSVDERADAPGAAVRGSPPRAPWSRCTPSSRPEDADRALAR